MTITGRMVSFAGKPRRNAARMIPSRPIIRPRGSKNPEISLSSDSPSIEILASSHSIMPVGAATHTALPRTNNVRSKTERMITLRI